MDFQSAARFGERRVMVTDYDETAVEVNAKVVDEDTGEVICESGGGGGESDFDLVNVTINVIAPEGVTLTATDASAIILYPDPDKMDSVYYGHYNFISGQPNQVLVYNGLAYISSIQGFDANYNTYSMSAHTETGDILYEADDNWFKVTGDGTITVTLSLEQ